MRNQAREGFTSARRRRSGERGVSVLELLIMLVMVSVITGYALTRISGAQQFMRMENASREFMSYVDKARLDSVRRHAGPPGTLPQPVMSSVTITGPRSYRVIMDFDGDGVVDAPRNITIPDNQGVIFNTGTTPLPITISFNWRGRAVSTTPSTVATYVTPPNFSLQTTGAYGSVRSTAINLSTAGDASISNGNASSYPPNPVTIDQSVNANTLLRNANMRVTGY
jgi:type II secretory pathway pseudopilin PulG